MKDKNDPGTLELVPPKGPGRPRKVAPLTDRERQRRYRETTTDRRLDLRICHDAGERLDLLAEVHGSRKAALEWLLLEGVDALEALDLIIPD
jgi:hypothetical protein